MKKISLVSTLILLLISLVSCQSGTDSLEKITIHQLKNGSNTIVIEDKETIKIIEKAVNSAEKETGIVNMADPDYRIVLGEKAYFLWIGEKAATIMDTEDTSTIYSLSDNSIRQLNNLISSKGTWGK